VFSIFSFSFWIKLDKSDVNKSLFSNYEFNVNRLGENMLLKGLSQFTSVFSDLCDIHYNFCTYSFFLSHFYMKMLRFKFVNRM
jgi:hypothetical protein